MSSAIIKNDRRTINAWAMYDWANSVYMLVITSAIFPAYYNQVTKVNGSTKIKVLGFITENTAAYSIALGLSFGIIALLSPLLSSISDYMGNHRSFMKGFCYLGAIGCIVLFGFDGPSALYIALGGLMLATIGYSGSIVFYNSYLPAIATEDQQDMVSAKGYSLGYFGATILLIVNLAAILNQKALGIEDGTLLPRLSFLLTGVWWIGFAQITFKRLPHGIYEKRPHGHILLNGYRELIKVWHSIKEERGLRSFLLSFFFYIMGVQTVMFMASAFGEKEVHMKVSDLIITILILQYVGIGGSYLFAWISEKIGNLRAMIIAVGLWVFICLGAYLIQTPFHFYIAGFFIGLVMGGVQSLSRSTYAKMIPKTENNAGYFSFYDVCEKLAMMFGLVMWGYLEHITGSMRNSITALVIWFCIGLAGLIWVNRIRRNPAVA